MGMLRIETAGSFLSRPRFEVSAMTHGHAQAVAEAISYLAEVIMPEAIRLDHRLHEEGDKPPGDDTFGPFGAKERAELRRR